MGGLLVVEDVEQRLGKAVERGGVDAFGGEDRAADERKVRPIDQRHPIQQEELLRHGDRVTRFNRIAKAELLRLRHLVGFMLKKRAAIPSTCKAEYPLCLPHL